MGRALPRVSYPRTKRARNGARGQDPNGLALLVEETGVLALRRGRGTGLAEVRKRAAAILTTADRRG